MTPLVEKVAKAIRDRLEITIPFEEDPLAPELASAVIDAARPDILREAAAVARNMLGTPGWASERIAAAIERLADGLERIRQP